MPSTIKIKISSATHIPHIQNNTSTPPTLHCSVSLGGHNTLLNPDPEETPDKTYSAKTKSVVCRSKTLGYSPVWDEEFRFDVADDRLLQDEPLLFKVSDSSASLSSQLGSSGAFGLVYIDLNPLIMRLAEEESDDEGQAHGDEGDTPPHAPPSSPPSKAVSPPVATPTSGSNPASQSGHSQSGHKQDSVLDLDAMHLDAQHSISGLFPIYDTLGGVRGELSLTVKLNFIGDVNPFRSSSAGVQLFPQSLLSPNTGMVVTHVLGFVEELTVAADPDYSLVSKIRQARSSNEIRQSLLYMLDCSVRRQLCRKVLEMGGNAVIGYCQNFDVEGDSGIVARCYGTAVMLSRSQEVDKYKSMFTQSPSLALKNSPNAIDRNHSSPVQSAHSKSSHSRDTHSREPSPPPPPSLLHAQSLPPPSHDSTDFQIEDADDILSPLENAGSSLLTKQIRTAMQVTTRTATPPATFPLC